MDTSNEDQVYVSIDMEHMLSFLFGKQKYHGAVGYTSFKTWKDHVQKILVPLRKKVEKAKLAKENRERALSLLGEMEESAKKASSSAPMNSHLVSCLLKLSFELMGGVPDNWDKK